MKNTKIICACLLILAVGTSFFSCKKKDVYRAQVLVTLVDPDFPEVRTPVPDCKLIFGEDDFADDIKRTVYTDENGIYRGAWPREVSLRIQASKEIDGVLYVGVSIVRVEKTGSAEVEILLKRNNMEERG